jgi:hypothetical protein
MLRTTGEMGVDFSPTVPGVMNPFSSASVIILYPILQQAQNNKYSAQI